MKRSMYAIPLATFGLSLSGCGDPIVATFNATAFDGEPFPAVDPEYTVSFSMTVAEDLTASVDYIIEYVDPVATDYIAKFSGTVSVVEKGAKYDISFNFNDELVSLTCTMDEKINLSCEDAEGAVFAFEVIQ
jgi:hypothetical protein